ncbi:hypothetical protein Bca52824_034993 [Brassica carinata]|uniref:Uncharacterized protein n=1 Tax=Brassica carinata TaxID=52824 RepID=A0A8X7V3P8_BRACI|nr:hypothetical protein Bca52824_034993 [Brassica carinata]
MDRWCAFGIIGRILSTPVWIAFLSACKCTMSPFRFNEAENTSSAIGVSSFLISYGCSFDTFCYVQRNVLINIVLLDQHSHLIRNDIFRGIKFLLHVQAIWRGAGDCNYKQEASPEKAVHHNAADHFMDMACEQGFEKQKSSTTPTDDLGFGLEQLQLMSKVKNIASLQLYGEEQASVIAIKQLHHRTHFITMPVEIRRSLIKRSCLSGYQIKR